MARTRRISTTAATAAAIWAASAGLTVTAWPRAAGAQVAPATAPATTPDLSPADRSAAEVRALAETLEAPEKDATPHVREEAARRLAMRGASGGNDVLARVIRGANGKEAKIAALRGIAAHPSPPPGLIAPIAALLPDRTPGVNDAAADALAVYKDDPRALTALADFARDGNQSPFPRTNVIRAMGGIPDPRTAAALAALLGEKPTIRNAAIDALEELTGRHDIGADAASWRRWQQQNANKSVAQWKADVLGARAVVQDDLRRRNQELANELSNRLAQEFNAANAQQKPAVLLNMLRSSVADVRAIGADLVGKGFLANTLAPPAGELRDRLIDAVGDSSRDVRLQAALTLYKLNEFGAYDALLAQLPVERDENVRVAQLRLLGQLEIHPNNKQIRSVALIRGLLSDPSLLVQKAAADAIHQFGPALVKQDAALKARQAQELSQELSKVIGRTTGEPDAADVRNASIAALGALRSPIILDLAPQLLKRNESTPTRIATVRALAELGDSKGGDRIADWLPQEADKAVRYAALIALGRISGLERLDTFLAAMDPKLEADESVRTGAREVIVSLLPNANEEQLTRVAQAQPFKEKDREMRVAILKALAARLEQRGEVESLAIQRESIGGDLLELGRPGEAVPYLQQSIDYYEKQNAGGLTMEKLIGRLTTALLQSKQYLQAADFASRTLKRDGSQMQSLGRMLTQEADRLKEAGKADDAIALIDAALKMNPPLDNRYLTLLREIKAQAEQRRPKTPRPPPSSQPQAQPAAPAPPPQ